MKSITCRSQGDMQVDKHKSSAKVSQPSKRKSLALNDNCATTSNLSVRLAGQDERMIMWTRGAQAAEQSSFTTSRLMMQKLPRSMRLYKSNLHSRQIHIKTQKNIAILIFQQHWWTIYLPRAGRPQTLEVSPARATAASIDCQRIFQFKLGSRN